MMQVQILIQVSATYVEFNILLPKKCIKLEDIGM